MPNKHGLGYKRLIRMENGPALFGAWCSMCQVVSRQVCDRNGYLTDTGLPDGKPLTAIDIGLLTDIDPDLIQKMLDACASAEIGWINDDLSVSCPDTIGANQDIDKNLKSDMTGEGEGEGKGKGGGEERDILFQEVQNSELRIKPTGALTPYAIWVDLKKSFPHANFKECVDEAIKAAANARDGINNPYSFLKAYFRKSDTPKMQVKDKLKKDQKYVEFNEKMLK